VREKQLLIVEKYHDATVRAGVEEIAVEVAALHPLQYLPLAQLVFPSLRRSPAPAIAAIPDRVERIDPRPMAAYNLRNTASPNSLRVQVIDALDPSKTRPTGSLKLTTCSAELTDVFAIVAGYGNDNPADAQRAYLLGMHEVMPDAIPEYAALHGVVGCARSRAPGQARPAYRPAGKELLVTRFDPRDWRGRCRHRHRGRICCARYARHCIAPLPADVGSGRVATRVGSIQAREYC